MDSKSLFEQILHDISGQITVLSITNELCYENIQQNSTQTIVDMVIKYRDQNCNHLDTLTHDSMLNFLEKLIEKTTMSMIMLKNIENGNNILNILNSIVNLSIGFRSLLENKFDIIDIQNLAREKKIEISNYKNCPLKILLSVILALKNENSIKTQENQLIISNIGYNIENSRNGILEYLKNEYEINIEFSIRDKTNTISWKEI